MNVSPDQALIQNWNNDHRNGEVCWNQAGPTETLVAFGFCSPSRNLKVDIYDPLHRVEEGPTAPSAPGAVPDNLALKTNGAISFASSELGPQIGLPYHLTENINDALALCFSVPFQLCLLLGGMSFIFHEWTKVAFFSLCSIFSAVGLYFFWYRNLKSEEQCLAEDARFGKKPPEPEKEKVAALESA